MAKREHKQILVVDDDPVSLMMIVENLTDAGYEPLAANDAFTALGQLLEHGPRVVISDWNMPKMDGLALCRQIRLQPSQLYVYFLMLTVESDKDRLVTAFDAGVDDFVSKPCHCGELLGRVRAGVRLVEMYDELLERTACSQQLNSELVRLNARLQQAATTDDLTGLCNRRQAMIRLNEQWDLARRYGTDFAVAMVDVDHFKAVNDAYGHVKGDECLQKLAEILARNVRGTDIVCRVGGEEFLILFPSQNARSAMVCVERCRQAVESGLVIDPAQSQPITISIGLSQFSRDFTVADDLLRAADTCLYDAKHQGRNRTIVFSPTAAIAAPV